VRLSTCVGVLSLFLFHSLRATEQLNSPGSGHISYVPIPSDLSRQDVLSANEVVKARLVQIAKSLTSSNIVAAPADLVVIFTDQSGVPILPDLENAHRQSRTTFSTIAAPASPNCPTNELSFTFNSSEHPWTPEEIATLNSWLNDFYPTAKAICGNPFFGITVNIRKDPTIPLAGFYYPSLNEMVLSGTNSPDVFCHEMIHAFRDDLLMGLATFEEGMTRACEIEVFNQLPNYPHWDKNHSYGYDVFYEGINRQNLGAQSGSLSAIVNPLLRYQLAGYAWAKCFFESADFFARFNCELNQRSLVDATTPNQESKLLAIATNIVPIVEGKDLVTWYHQQGIFNTDPPKGYFLSQRVNQFYVDFDFRDNAGKESPQANAAVSWTVFDYQNQVLDSGDGITRTGGWIDATPRLDANNYAGRLRLVAQSMSPNGLITQTAYRSTGSFGVVPRGIFGAVVTADTGTVTISSVDLPSMTITVNVVNGAFSAPTFLSARGRFLAEFSFDNGVVYTRRFNKDASNYYLELRPPILSITPTGQPQELNLTLGSELDQSYQIESSTNFTTWIPLLTLTNLTGDISFTITNTTPQNARFYRARR
jgi:hypothetical protein